MALIKLKVLGGFQLFGRGGKPYLLPTRKAEALFAYLALPLGRAHRRERLAALLWGDRADKQARHSLNQTVFSIRKALAGADVDPILVNGETLALNADLIEVDAMRFQDLTGGRQGGIDADAAALYDGDLLEGFGLRSPAFEDWLAVERARLHELALAALNRVLSAEISARKHAAALQTALRIIALDPLQESIHRALMQIYADLGRVDAALRQYESCQATLRRELDVAPEAETEALFRELSDRRLRGRDASSGTQHNGPASQIGDDASGSVEATAVVERAASEPFGSERKVVTVLVCELVPGNEADLDPEIILEFLDDAFDALTAAVERYQGTLVSRQVQGITALFGAPAAQEDHAIRGCYAALMIQESIASLSGRRLCVCVGLSSGPAIVRYRNDNGPSRCEAIGPAVNMAGRIQQTVPADELGLDPLTLQLAKDFVEAEAAEPSAFERGDLTQIYHLRRCRPLMRPWQARRARGLGRFVGREREMDLLKQDLADAHAGQGRLITVVGDPGVGKSRLMHEFIRSCVTTEWRVLEAGASPLETVSAYGMIGQLLRALCGVSRRDSQADLADKVRTTVLTIDDSLASALPVLFALVDLPVEDEAWATLAPAQRRQRIFLGVRALLSRLAQTRPLMIVLEDLHWSDSETQALLDTLVGSLDGSRLLLLVTHRPELRHDWSGRSGFGLVRLNPLPDVNADALLRHLMGDHPSLTDARRLLIESTGGTPLFLEETVHALAESGVLAGHQGHYLLRGDLGNIEIPSSVHAVLAARLDRLPPGSKALLQAASIVGVEVPDNLLRPIANVPDDSYQAAIDTLKSSELLYEAQLLPEISYRFKHALVQDVAYDSLLISQRQRLHARVAEALDKQFQEAGELQPALLAHHYEAAGLWDRALVYWQRAGMQANSRSNYTEAEHHLTRAIDLVPRLSPGMHAHTEFDLQMALGAVYRATRGTGSRQTEQAYERARGLGEGILQPERLLDVIYGQFICAFNRPNLHEAERHARDFLDIARDCNASAVAVANQLVGTTAFILGDLIRSRRLLEQCLQVDDVDQALLDLYSHRQYPNMALTYLSWGLFVLGFPEEAHARSKEALSTAEETSAFFYAMALGNGCYLHHFCGDHAAVEANLEAMLDLTEQKGLVVFHEIARVFQGWTHVRRGAIDRGVDIIRDALTGLRATDQELEVPYLISIMAEAFLQAGRWTDAQVQLDEALRLVRATDERWYEAELHRLAGEVALAQGDRVKAETQFQHALAVAHAQSARMWELRAVKGLARIWQGSGRLVEAHRLVARILDGFTEGFDTADLMDGKMLLEELAEAHDL
ncbi:MAG: AAA family ATPase [Alphaproteobacteria bacterium]